MPSTDFIVIQCYQYECTPRLQTDLTLRYQIPSPHSIFQLMMYKSCSVQNPNVNRILLLYFWCNFEGDSAPLTNFIRSDFALLVRVHRRLQMDLDIGSHITHAWPHRVLVIPRNRWPPTFGKLCRYRKLIRNHTSRGLCPGECDHHAGGRGAKKKDASYTLRWQFLVHLFSITLGHHRAIHEWTAFVARQKEGFFRASRMFTQKFITMYSSWFR